MQTESLWQLLPIGKGKKANIDEVDDAPFHLCMYVGPIADLGQPLAKLVRH
jgi:hypothetical protein